MAVAPRVRRGGLCARAHSSEAAGVAICPALPEPSQARLPVAPGYCTLALTALDAPCLLVSVTDTLVIPAALPLMVKGCVKVNRLPNGCEVASLYHVPKIWSTGTVTCEVCRLVPADAVNWNVALTMSRELEKPVTSTVKPPAVCCAATLVM